MTSPITPELRPMPRVYKGRYGIWYIDFHRAGQRIRRSTKARTKQAALTALAIAMSEDTSEVPTFASYSTTWLERRAGSLRRSTLEGYRRACREALLVIGDKPMDRITRADARRVAEALATPERSQRTLQNLLAGLQSCFSAAADDLLTARGDTIIRSNPFRSRQRLLEGLAPDPDAGLDDHANPYDHGELEALLGRIHDPADRLKVLIGAEAGLRRSEVLALHWEDLDLTKGEMRVSRRFSRNQIGAPKSRHSARRVPLTDRLLETLGSWRLQQREEQLRKGKPLPEMVFPSRGKRAGYEGEQGFSRRMERYLRDAGVTSGTHPFHRLRHTFCVRLLSAGVPSYLVSRWAGHGSSQFTERTYGRWLPNAEDRSRLNDALHPPEWQTRWQSPGTPGGSESQP